MKLIVQPDAGLTPIITAIKLAKKTIDIMIFRLHRQQITRALEAAVARGVAVRALIAHTNSGGEKTLRKLELRLLEQGVSVSRTADDLVRYHAKMIVVDHRVLHVYGFNLTGLDIERSRSFGMTTKNPELVQEAVRLFEADAGRQPFVPSCDRLIVSPETARERIADFIKGARKQLLIYDPNVSDPAMVRLLTERAAKGVDVRIIGRLDAKKAPLTVERYPGKRLHVRAIVRDGRHAFVGSQSLRKIELEQRREVGIIASEPGVVKQIQSVFEQDWALTAAGKKAARNA
jgi:phosphatidylserine/phosphatidylglycerophosphate/cardiolipin synthase-like enzyme